MKKKFSILLRMTFMLLMLFSYSCQNPENTDRQNYLTDLVNTDIGAISHLLVPTYPTVHLPNSMIRIYPRTTPGVNDHYLASKIFSFPVNIPSHRQGLFTTLMVTSDNHGDSTDFLASTYDHDFERSTPYY